MISILSILATCFICLDMILYLFYKYFLKVNEELESENDQIYDSVLEEIDEVINKDKGTNFILQNNISYSGKFIWFIVHLATIWGPLIIIHKFSGLSLLEKPSKEVYQFQSLSIILFLGLTLVIRYVYFNRSSSKLG